MEPAQSFKRFSPLPMIRFHMRTTKDLPERVDLIALKDLLVDGSSCPVFP